MTRRNILIVGGVVLLALGWFMRDFTTSLGIGSGIRHQPYRRHGGIVVIIGAGVLATGLVSKK